MGYDMKILRGKRNDFYTMMTSKKGYSRGLLPVFSGLKLYIVLCILILIQESFLGHRF